MSDVTFSLLPSILFEYQLLFDYPNVVDDTYTGALNVTLSLTTYLTSEKKHSKDTPLHLNSPLLFPLSKLSLNSSSLFAVGGDNGDSGVTQVTIPKNAESALVEIFASGTYHMPPDDYLLHPDSELPPFNL